MSRATSKACGGNSNRTASLIDPPQIGLSKSKPTLPDTAETAQERTDARRLLVMGKYIKKNPSLALTLGPEDAAKLNIDVVSLCKKFEILYLSIAAPNASPSFKHFKIHPRTVLLCIF